VVFLVRVLCAVFLVLLPTASFAGAPVTPTYTHSAVDATSGSIGLRFEFGDVVKPSIVGAVRQTHTTTNNDVTGILTDIAIPLNPESNFLPTIRVMGVFGGTNTQGLGGFGFDFSENQAFLGLGLQGGHLEGGVHLDTTGTFIPYVGVSNYGAAPTRTTTVVK